MNQDLHFSSKSDEWETPKWLFDLLNEEFIFKLDAAATKENCLCKNYFTQEQDALQQNWSIHNTVFCNPPYGRKIGRFVKKGYEESLKNCIVVSLIPARTDTKWWCDYCSKGEVRFIKGRIKFINKTFPSFNENDNFKIFAAPFPSAIVVFDKTKKSATRYVDLKIFQKERG